MTLHAFGELGLELLGRNQQDFKIDERVFLAAAQTFLAQLIEEKYKGNAPSSFFKEYLLTVQSDTVKELLYVEPSPKVLQMDDNNGISYIGAKGDEFDINSSYILLRPSQISQYAGLEAQSFGGRPAAKPLDDRIYLYNTSLSSGDTILAVYIPQLTDMDDDDEMFGSSLDNIVLQGALGILRRKSELNEDKSTDSDSKQI